MEIDLDFFHNWLTKDTFSVGSIREIALPRGHELPSYPNYANNQH